MARRNAHGDEDPLDLPEYVEQSLRAWCAFDAARRDATPHVSEARQMYPAASCYDPESDWLDEPFPEEYE